ncbi:DUF6497 family protein [Aquicoccus porphyridii]|uniref:DUF6497 family protein n=1 Tax=Aquicoccus porphyridii TaxID=1852029 RepID=UPI00273DEF8C|nr:DUF6497 family protein [Aquicoccus porphyridii]
MPSPSRTARDVGHKSRAFDTGARRRGRGLCALAGVAMVAAGAKASAGDPGAMPVPPLPSGLDAELHEMFLDVKPDGLLTYARFRFIAPDIAGADAPDFSERIGDMEFLCDSYAMPHVAATPEPVDRIVISLSDRAVAFGQPDPDATQFFEAFSIENGACIWEEF